MANRRERLPRHVRRHGNKFRCVIKRNGRTHRSPVFPTPEKAAAWAAAFDPSEAPDHPLTLSDGLGLVMRSLDLRARSQGTVDYYDAHFLSLTSKDGWHPDYPLHRITERLVVDYVHNRRKKGIKDRTIFAKELQVLNRIFELAIRAGALVHNPVRRVERPQMRSGRYSYLPETTVLNLVQAMRDFRDPSKRSKLLSQERDADLVLLFYGTGMRRSEAARVRTTDIDWPGRRIFVRGKNADRHVPITPLVEAALGRLVAAAEPGGAITPTAVAISKVFEAWQGRLEERTLTPHVLRHSFATELVRRGVHPMLLQRLMGHANHQQTQRYYHASGQDLFDAASLLGQERPAPPTLRELDPSQSRQADG